MTVNRNSLYCCSAMYLFSLGAGRYTGYTEFLISLQLLQINSGSVPRINKRVKMKFSPVTYCQPTDRRSVVVDHIRKIRKERGQNERKKQTKEEKREDCRITNLLNEY